MKKDNYIKSWFRDFRRLLGHELRLIFTDSGVLIIFLLAGLAYPLLYNVVYLNGNVNDTPVAVVDEAGCAESRRFAREVDATRECSVAYRCVNMAEAEDLMKEGKVRGIFYFPPDFGEKLARCETAVVSVYADMSSFLYYKNAMTSGNMVMLQEMRNIQIERYTGSGMSVAQAEQLVQPIPYEENNPYNRTFSYQIFLISAILLVIIQQTLFYGMSLLVGTSREENRNVSSLPGDLQGHGVGRMVIGRGAAYWLIYMAIGLYIAFIVPAIFGIPQRGEFADIVILLVFFVTDCVLFAMSWSILITRRESVFLLFLVVSPICLFLTGFSWPTTAFPAFWRWFSYIFPTTFGCQGFINLSTAGGGLGSASVQFTGMTIQIVVYYFLACTGIYVESWMARKLHHPGNVDKSDNHEEVRM